MLIYVQGNPDLTSLESPKVVIKRVEKRLTYSDFLREVSSPEQSQYDLISCANSDIYFTKDICKLMHLPKESLAALTRWEDSGVLFRFRECSQDSWFLRPGAIPENLINSTGMRLGVPGCELRFAAEMYCHGFSIFNPSESVQTIHNDECSEPSDGDQPSQRYGGLYLRTKPCTIEQMLNGEADSLTSMHVKKYDPLSKKFQMIQLEV
jgi:hypothetical protein